MKLGGIWYLDTYILNYRGAIYARLQSKGTEFFFFLSIIKIENVSNFLNSILTTFLICLTKCSRDHGFLLFLNVQHLVFDAISHNETDNFNISLLAKAMDPVKALVLSRRVPCRVHENEVVSSIEI